MNNLMKFELEVLRKKLINKLILLAVITFLICLVCLGNVVNAEPTYRGLLFMGVVVSMGSYVAIIHNVLEDYQNEFYKIHRKFN